MPLVIKRRLGERLMIGPNIEVRLTQILGNGVALEITAPEYLQVNRMGKEQDQKDRAEMIARMTEKAGRR